jgi:nitrite reductase/ring-hydroxylating ferredoxin subunit
VKEIKMATKISRRDFLKITGATGAAFLLSGCGPKNVTADNRGFLDRLVGRPITDLPQVIDAWTYQNNTLTLDLEKLPELETLGGAVRIEGEVLADPVLVILGDDGEYYAFKNACTHSGRMVDPLVGTMTLECCSVSQSTFDYAGNVLSGPAEGPLTSYPLFIEDGILQIDL